MLRLLLVSIGSSTCQWLQFRDLYHKYKSKFNVTKTCTTKFRKALHTHRQKQKPQLLQMLRDTYKTHTIIVFVRIVADIVTDVKFTQPQRDK